MPVRTRRKSPAAAAAAKLPVAKLPVARAVRGELADAAAGVRRALAAVVETVCGGAPRAQDVTDRFGIYRKLGWQIWNVVYDGADPLAAIRYLPNSRSMKVWSDAVERLGVDQRLLARLDEAIASFQRSADAHAQDREMLEMLVESQSDGTPPDEASQAKWRKQAFTGNAFTWGVRARCMLATAVIFPSKRDGFFDMVRIQGLIGLVRTRSNVRWPFAQLLVRDEEGKKRSFAREPLAMTAAVKKTGVPLLEEFCSKPLPAVQRRPGNMGIVEDELLPGEVGQTAAADVITGETLREVAPVWAQKAGETVHFGTGVRTPSELFISDQLVHRSLYPGVTRELRVYGELMTQLSRDERDLLPVAERVQHLGRAGVGIATADVPRYGDLLEFIFAKSGLDPDEFDAFRVRMRYPPIPVSVMVRHEMPMRPAGA